MAGSFSIFRKNQKLLLAALTLLSMFAFVFLDPIFRYLGSSQAPRNPVLVETKYGNLKRTDIDSLISNRRLADHFISGVIGMSVDKLVDQQKIDPRSREAYVKMITDQWRSQLLQRSGATDEEQALETMLLARQAEQMGMVVSDAAVNQLIRELSGDTLNQRDLTGLSARLHVGEQRLFEALRTEIAASRAMQLFRASLGGVPPGQRFDYFNRLNRRATIEAVAVPVANFVDQVKDPGDATLKAFFEKHKHQIARPGSPEPGFKIPRRERFQYFKAEYDLFLQLAEVSEEEIQKYYDEHKTTMFRKLELPSDKAEPKEDSKVEPDINPEPEPGPEKPEAASPADKNPTPNADQPVEPAESTDAKPAATEEPATEAPKADAPEAEAPKADAPKPDTPETKPDGAASNRQVLFHLVADTKASDGNEAEPREDASKEPEQNASEKSEPEKKDAEDRPAEEASTEPKPAGAKPADSKEPAADAAPQYEPLEKVREQIVSAIKSEKAQQKIQAATEALAARMRSYSDARDVYLVEKAENPAARAPQELDFVSLAKEQGVAYGETKLATLYELSNSELGKTFARVRADVPMQFRAAPFVEVAFGPKIALYSNIATEDIENNRYLSWKIEQADERVPSFDEVRDEVLSAWKMIQARELARKQAETYAAEAKGETKSLTDVLGKEKDIKVVTAGPFSWMTTGSTPDQGQNSVVMLSEVEGIENPGQAFMETVFSLSAGATGVCANHPQDIYYAVEVEEFDPPQSELEEDFARQEFRRYANVAIGDTRQTYQAWVQSLSDQAGVKWLQEPVQTDQSTMN